MNSDFADNLNMSSFADQSYLVGLGSGVGSDLDTFLVAVGQNFFVVGYSFVASDFELFVFAAAVASFVAVAFAVAAVALKVAMNFVTFAFVIFAVVARRTSAETSAWDC